MGSEAPMVREQPKSKGGIYYRAHRERELTRKKAWRARVDSAFKAFRAVWPNYQGLKRDFLKLVRSKGWAIPVHTRKKPAPAVQERERKFVEEALGKHGFYRGPRYPFDQANEEDLT
jgi:hypothetical protein